MADISRFSSTNSSRINTAQAVLEARARKNSQSSQNENGATVSGGAKDTARDTAQTFQVAKTSSPAHKGYLEQEEVSFRARVMSQDETPENIRSLARLKRTFDSGQPLRGDVPRGYYLNLRV